MIFNPEQESARRTREARELAFEAREAKEGDTAELKKAAAMERADFLSKEIQNSAKQMQHILIHMQEVTAAIRRLRELLQVADHHGDPASVQEDKARIYELKKKISAYQDELVKMKGDLVREQVAELKNGVGVGLSSEALEHKAKEIVERMIQSVVSGV